MRTPRENGRVEVITGCMFSGKTEELLSRIRRAEQAEKQVAAFTPSTDDRYGEGYIGSHIGRRWEAEVVDRDNPQKIIESLNGDEDVIAIDEANFFNDDLPDVCNRLADNDYRVIVSGTDQTFRGEPFKPVPTLMATAEYVKKMSQAVCERCGDPASRNQRLIDNEPAPSDAPTIQVGGEETYEARCRDCHTVPKPETTSDD